MPIAAVIKGKTKLRPIRDFYFDGRCECHVRVKGIDGTWDKVVPKRGYIRACGTWYIDGDGSFCPFIIPFKRGMRELLNNHIECFRVLTEIGIHPSVT